MRLTPDEMPYLVNDGRSMTDEQDSVAQDD